MKISYMTCRIQFLNDVDPFGYSSGLEPPRPPSYVFNTRLPLGSQLPSVHRQLMAPQKVRETEVMRGNGLILVKESCFDGLFLTSSGHKIDLCGS